jgi:signal transduction histidine kinase
MGTLFIIVPNTLAEDVASLVNNQTITNFTIIGIIVVISMVAAIFLLRWNKFLNDAVKQKTRQLSETVEKLSEANDELKSHDIMQKEFINIAAHELRTPTQGISGNLELLEMTVLPSLFREPSNSLDNIKQELQRIVRDENSLKNFVGGLLSIRRNTERLQKLVNDILDTSRIEGKRLNLEKESFNLNEKIQNVINDIHSKRNLDSSYGNPSKHVNILFEPHEDPINVFADKIRIFEVISNLTNNAIKFSDGQSVIISSKKVKKKEIGAHDYLDPHSEKHMWNETENNDKEVMMAVVSIRDKGKGIDPDILPRLFTKFTTKSSHGTGLGLYIAKSIVEAHGGQIWAQHNFDDGKGTIFTFSLPLE